MLEMGLTGMIGSGKSLVAGILRSQGFYCVDADRLWADLMRKGRPGWRAVVRLFGPSVLDPRGNICRRKLRAVVFGSPAKRKALERLSHPLIERAYREISTRLRRRRRSLYRGLCLEAALLLQSPIRRRFKWILLIKAPTSCLIRRLKKRPLEPALLRKVVREQQRRYQKLRPPRNVRVIVNNGSQQALKKRVFAFLHEIKKAG